MPCIEKEIAMYGRLCNAFSLILCFCLISMSAPLAADRDSFLAGYVTAVMQRDFNMDSPGVEVRDGIVSIDGSGIPQDELDNIVRELTAIEGVRSVKFRRASAGGHAVGGITQPAAYGEGAGFGMFLSGGQLFKPLLADPLWPRFSVTRGYFRDNGGLDDVVHASIGDTMPVYTDSTPYGKWQFVTFALVDTINDLDTDSWDLINADFTFGIGFAQKRGDFSGILRLIHLSSHAGDEYVINSGAERVSYSYQSVDMVLSYDFRNWLRSYAGGAYRFSTTPKDLEPWELRYGVELESLKTYFGFARPIAALDMHHTEERNWEGAVSLRAGIEIDRPLLSGHSLRFTAGYFNGPSHFGQFYRHYHEYFDFGVQFNF
jgi:hypothetical protein